MTSCSLSCGPSCPRTSAHCHLISFTSGSCRDAAGDKGADALSEAPGDLELPSLRDSDTAPAETTAKPERGPRGPTRRATGGTLEKTMLSTSSLGEWKRSESLPDSLLSSPWVGAHSRPSPTPRKFSHSERETVFSQHIKKVRFFSFQQPDPGAQGFTITGLPGNGLSLMK